MTEFAVDVVERYTARVEAASEEGALAAWRDGKLDLVLVDERVSCVWDAATSAEPRWIVVEYEGSNPVEAVIVTAPTEQEAAEQGAEFIWQEAIERADARDGQIEPPRRVFVAPWSRVAYRTEFVAQATVAEHQCCGGGPHAEWVGNGGHWGGCPVHDAPDESPEESE